MDTTGHEESERGRSSRCGIAGGVVVVWALLATLRGYFHLKAQKRRGSRLSFSFLQIKTCNKIGGERGNNSQGDFIMVLRESCGLLSPPELCYLWRGGC